MKKILSLLCCSLVCLCGMAQVVTKPYEIKGKINKIDVKGAVEVRFTVSDDRTMTAQASARALDRFKVNLRGGKLSIAYDHAYNDRSKFSFKKLRKNERKVVVNIAVPAVENIDLGGLSKVKITGPNVYRVSKMLVNMNGCSELDIETSVETGNFTCNASGNADIDMKYVHCSKNSFNCSGNCDVDVKHLLAESVNAEVSGNADLDIKSLHSPKINISCSGNSGMDIDNLESVSVVADASGNASLDLSGATQSVKFEASGNSSIDAAHLQASHGTANAWGISTIKSCVTSLSTNSSNMAKVKNKPFTVKQ